MKKTTINHQKQLLSQVRSNIELAKNKNIPPSWKFPSYSTGIFELREEFITHGSFAAVSKDWVSKLAAWIGESTVLEIGAGNGMLARALQEFGVTITPTDDFSWKESGKLVKDSTYKKKSKEIQTWTEVLKLDYADAIEKFGADLLLLCWPPYSEPLATNAVEAFFQKNPTGLVIYIGEGFGGCTANDRFFEVTEPVDDSFDERFFEAANLFRSWPGIHDQLSLVRRSTSII